MAVLEKGDKVRVHKGQYVGLEGVVIDSRVHTHDGEYYDLEVTTKPDNHFLDWGGPIQFHEEYLEKIAVREVGKEIDPDDVKAGDKIKVTVTYPDMVVERIGKVGLITTTGSKGSITHNITTGMHWEAKSLYRTVSDRDAVITLLEEAPVKHPLDDAPVGAEFSHNAGLYHKYLEGWWVLEKWDGCELLGLETVDEADARNAFDSGDHELTVPDVK